MNDIVNNVTVIIRSVKERTTNACYELVLQQGIPAENIHTVNESPFAKALRRSYEIGAEKELKWTCCVDGDVLLRQNSIRDIIAYANKLSSSVFEVQGLVLDKFIGGPRTGGIHLYRSALLPKAIELIPSREEVMRPESSAILRMNKLGHKWVKTPLIVGLHDYEQYYFDIFRTCFVHSRKHKSLLSLFINDWALYAKNDKDFEVAYLALLRGLEYSGQVHIDVTQSIYKEEFDKLKIKEKEHLGPKSVNVVDIDAIINNYQPSTLFLQHEPSFAGFGVSRRDKIRSIIKNMGLFGSLCWFVGYTFKRTGEKILKHQYQRK